MYNITASMRYASMANPKASNEEYLFWHKYWNMIRDVVLGEIMIKNRTTHYLPRFEDQTDEEYRAYLQRAIFYNMTARTVNSLTGAVHVRDPIIENLPDSIDLLNVTKDGQSFNAFAKKMTRELITMGRYGILIDAPEEGGDPYFAPYIAEDILDWSFTTIRGRTKVKKVVLREYTSIENSVGTNTIDDFVRVLILDEDGIYRQRIYPDGDPTSLSYMEITPLRNGEVLREIPFLFMSPYDFGTDIEKPPILDIALLNISHYQAYAHLQSGRYFTATPVWAVFLHGSSNEDTEYKVGGNAVWQFGDQDDARLIEYSGSGLKYMENALDMLEHQIVSLGGKLGASARGTAAESDTSVSAREKGEQTFVHSMLTIMGDGLTALLRELALWHGTPAPDLTVRLANDSLNMYMTDREIRAIKSLYETGMIPIESLYGIFKDANIIPPNMNMQEFKERLPTISPQTKQELIKEEFKSRSQERRVIRPPSRTTPGVSVTQQPEPDNEDDLPDDDIEDALETEDDED